MTEHAINVTAVAVVDDPLGPVLERSRNERTAAKAEAKLREAEARRMEAIQAEQERQRRMIECDCSPSNRFGVR